MYLTTLFLSSLLSRAINMGDVDGIKEICAKRPDLLNAKSLPLGEAALTGQLSLRG